MVLSLFLEGSFFSFYFFDVKIRCIHLLEIVTGIYLFFCIFSKQIKYRFSPIDLFIWGYVVINFISLFKADWFGRSLKIAVLLFSLALLYSFIYNILETKKVFKRAFNLLVYVGILEIMYGLYQVFAGMMNWLLNLRLPIGYLGLIHVQYIGSPWGRPYGTLVEPDWYGAVCMFYVLLLSILACVDSKKKLFYIVALNISILGLFFSFVRAAWIGAALGVLFIFCFELKYKFTHFNILKYIRNFIPFFIVFCLTISFFPPVRVVLKERLHPTYDTGASLSVSNARIGLIKNSVNAASKSILIGTGPGSSAFHYLALEHGVDRAKELTKDKVTLNRGAEGFDPSLVSTVFTDTGIIGLIIFFLLISAFVYINFRTIPLLSGEFQLIGLGLFLGISGLLVSYVFTQGLWIPFTWVFLAFNMGALRVGLPGEVDAYVKKE